MKRIKNIILFLFCLQTFESNAQTISGIVNSYFKATYYASQYNALKVPGVTGLVKGDRVLIIQMKGAVINETNSSSFGNITSINGSGQYEFATICGFVNDTVGFENTLLNTYDFTRAVQVIHVPVYSNVTINGILLAQEWNPITETGGVIAIEATGTITLNANISADSAGFKGGAIHVNTTNRCGPRSNWFYSQAQSSGTNLGGSPKGEGIATFITNKNYGRGKQASGGGGANVDNTGGGGGSNYGAGGNGGVKSNATFCNASTSGQGGLALNTFGYASSLTISSTDNRVFLGGGGGCGEMNNIYSAPYPAGTPGGDGGGIVFIKCNQLTGNGNLISANGAQGVNPGLPVITEAAGDGGGGGGAGGVVVLNVTSYSTTLSVSARGANGSVAGFQNQCPGPGGGGGGGVIWHSGVLPGFVTTNVTGGTNGIIKNAPAHNPPCELQPNGAVSGTNGIVRSGFQTFAGADFDCSVLSIESVKNWRGKKVSDGIQLQWQLVQTSSIEQIWVERKTVSSGFKVLKVYEQPIEGAYQYTDYTNELPATYRLLVLNKNGRKEYSNQLFFKREKVKRLNVYPNPTREELRIELPFSSFGKTTISIFDFTGKLVSTKEISFNTSQAIATINLSNLPAGTYAVRCYWKDELYIAKIIKQ